MLFPDLPNRVEIAPSQEPVPMNKTRQENAKPVTLKPRPFKASDREGMLAYLRSIHAPGPGWVPEPMRPDQVETSRSMAF